MEAFHTMMFRMEDFHHLRWLELCPQLHGCRVAAMLEIKRMCLVFF